MKQSKQLYTNPNLFIHVIDDDVVTASVYNIEWSWGNGTTPEDWVWEE